MVIFSDKLLKIRFFNYKRKEKLYFELKPYLETKNIH